MQRRFPILHFKHERSRIFFVRMWVVLKRTGLWRYWCVVWPPKPYRVWPWRLTALTTSTAVTVEWSRNHSWETATETVAHTQNCRNKITLLFHRTNWPGIYRRCGGQRADSVDELWQRRARTHIARVQLPTATRTRLERALFRSCCPLNWCRQFWRSL